MIKTFGEGRLTRNIEMRYSAEGTAIANFTVACDWYMKEKKTTFLRCVGFGKRAEKWSEFLGKGSAVTFIGNLEIREYEGKWYTTCIIDDLSFGPKQQRQDGYHDQRVEQDDQEDDLPF